MVKFYQPKRTTKKEEFTPKQEKDPEVGNIKPA